MRCFVSAQRLRYLASDEAFRFNLFIRIVSGIVIMTKIYIALWALYLLVVGAFYVTGNATPMAVVVFGFICFGMVFMGIMGVLPTAVHDSHVKH